MYEVGVGCDKNIFEVPEFWGFWFIYEGAGIIIGRVGTWAWGGAGTFGAARLGC